MVRKGGSTYLRFVTMMEAGRIFLDRPLSGIAFAWPLAAHNQYLSMLAIGGIVPFTFFSYLLLLLHRMVRFDIGDNRSRANDHRQSLGMYGILIVFVVSSFFQNNFTVMYTSCLFWSLVGVYEIDRNRGADKRTGGTIPWGRPGNTAPGQATTEER